MAWGPSGFIFAGNSGAGKSTLAAGLLCRGWRYFYDEFALVSPRSLHLHPFPKAICIKAGSFNVVRRLRLPLWNRLYRVRKLCCRVGYIETGALTTARPTAATKLWHRRPACDYTAETAVPQYSSRAAKILNISRTEPVTASRPIRYVIFPRFIAGAPTRLYPISRGQAAFALHYHVLNAAAFGHQTVPILTDVTRGARGFRLEFGELGAACRMLESLAAGAYHSRRAAV